MNNVMRMAAEIKRKRLAIQKTKSVILLSDYSKSIYKDIRDLKEYCRLKNIPFSTVTKYFME